MLNRSILRLSSLSLVAAAAVSVASLAISGCATGIIADPSPVTSAAKAPTLQGVVYGGSTPISGATITLWETDPTSSGYPSANLEKAKPLATTTTYAGPVGTCATAPCTDAITGYSITSNQATFTATNTLVAQQQVTLSGFATSTFFNGQTLYVTSASSSSFTVTFYHANVTATPETGTATEVVGSQSAGSWALTRGYSCDAPATGTAGPFLYLTSTGGNTGAGANTAAVLIAALGSCSSVIANSANMHIVINEASTIAAAYALGNFMYVDDTNPGSQQVYIGSTTTNNAVTGSCTGTGSTMACTAAGLSHAFANAYNLADNVGIGYVPTGQSKTSIWPNPLTGTAANANASIPNLELNTLADILSTCVNSTGGTPCTNLFAFTTTAGGTAAVDTLTAAINIAQNPGHNVGAAGPPATGLWSLVPSTGPFQPSLTGPPHDWSVSITYGSLYTPATATVSATGFAYSYTANASTGTMTVTANNSLVQGQTVTLTGFTDTSSGMTENDTSFNGTTVQVSSVTSTSFTGISNYVPSPSTASQTYTSVAGDSGTGTVAATAGQPQAVALDANDNVYATVVTTDADGVLASLSSSGAVNWITPATTGICGGFNVATDTANNVWVANYSSSTICPASPYGLYAFSQSSGSATQALVNSSTANIQTSPWGLAVDRSNNLWYGRKSTTCQSAAGTGANTAALCVAEIPYSAGSYGAAVHQETFGGSKLFNITHIVLDNNQNVWAGAYEGLSGSSYYPVGVVPNTGTAAAPTYASSTYATAVSSEAYGLIALDASNNLWTGSATSGGPESVYYYTYGSSVSAATGAYTNTTNSGFNPSKPLAGEFDGNGKLFFVSQSGSGQLWFYSPANQAASDTATTVAFNLVPCYNGTGASTCTVATTYPDMIQIDSTGSVWIAAGQASFATVTSTPGYVVQVIGTAAPAWPQLSYAKFGVKP